MHPLERRKKDSKGLNSKFKALDASSMIRSLVVVFFKKEKKMQKLNDQMLKNAKKQGALIKKKKIACHLDSHYLHTQWVSLNINDLT